MKKAMPAILLSLCLLLAGCSPGKLLEQVTGVSNADTYVQPTSEPTPHAKRVYMDEVTGPLLSFDGKSITIQEESGDPHTYDVTRAGLECAGGILGLQEISLIYEGKAGDEDFHVLKVSDALHQRNPLKEYVISGTLEKLTSWSAVIKDKDGKVYTLPTMARNHYFSKGLITGMPIYAKCLGQIPEESDASHPLVLVKDISDSDKFLPLATEPLVEETITDPGSQTQRMELTLDTLDNGVIKALPEGSLIPVYIDLNTLPCFFPTGLLPGTRLVIYYTGTFNGQDLNGLTISQVRGLDTSASHPTVQGTVQAVTLDTVTLACPDGAHFTFRNRGQSKVLVSEGENISVIVNPSASKETTIYTASRS